MWHTLPPLLWGAAPTGDGSELGLDRATSCLPCLLLQWWQGGADPWGPAASIGKLEGPGEGSGVGALSASRDLEEKIWVRASGQPVHGKQGRAGWSHGDEEGWEVTYCAI